MQGGWTALHRAADEGDEAAAEAAIAADPSSIEALTAGYRETPLHLACWSKDAALTRALLDHGARCDRLTLSMLRILSGTA